MKVIMTKKKEKYNVRRSTNLNKIKVSHKKSVFILKQVDVHFGSIRYNEKRIVILSLATTKKMARIIV